MREFKGTPGPWEWWTSNSFLRLSSRATGKDGDVIDSHRISHGHTSVSVKQTDMALIAAAPELLEALQLAKHVIENMLPANSASRTRVSEMAGKAISKALGD